MRTATFGLVLALLAGTGLAHADAQEPREPALVRAAAFVAGSLREGPTGLGVARDVRSVSFRLEMPRPGSAQPWVQIAGFLRPDLECPPEVPCNTDGRVALAGLTLPLSLDDTRPGVHPYFVAGAGAAFSTERAFAYLMGIGAAIPLTPRVAPALEIRWETLPGIRNVVMATLGLRVDLF